MSQTSSPVGLLKSLALREEDDEPLHVIEEAASESALVPPEEPDQKLGDMRIVQNFLMFVAVNARRRRIRAAKQGLR
jgi:hypothetical protein